MHETFNFVGNLRMCNPSSLEEAATKDQGSCGKTVCLPASLPVLAMRWWLGLGLFVLLYFSLGYEQEKEVIRSKMGGKVGLPCCYEIPSFDSLQNYRVYWQKSITEVVLAYAKGKKISRNERYDSRTAMDTRNFTLWISPVEILDNGSYHCVVQELKNSENPHVVCTKPVTFFVAADFSKPNVTAEEFANSCESTEMMVTCSSHGGFPKPKVSGALANKPVVWNASRVSQSSLSLYNVTAHLWLSVTEDISFTCSIEYNGFAQSTTLLLRKTNDCIVPTVPPPHNVIIASSIIIIIFLLALILAARYLPRHVCSHCCKPQHSVEEDVKEGTKPPTSSKMTSETSSV
ncbi:T-lymphocyte activation antigen CD80 [Dryobates pubescens]|uniref:T-lymphocyte activation antigen CD80 n=1 Tax=Dryobates pubescens TaxID=118200 RepID=UPI0023B8E8BE|nr:T-lymphocyte activation antigen CD80 [Dryobates pubescens]